MEAPGGEAGLRHTGWTLDIETDDTMYAYELDEATEAGAFLLGRRTYDRFNGMPTYVVSGTLTDPAWHNTTVLPDVDAVATWRCCARVRVVRYANGVQLQIFCRAA